VVSAKKYKRMMPAPDATAVAPSEESEEDTTARTRGIEAARRVEAQETGGREASAIGDGASASTLCSSSASTAGGWDSGATPQGRVTATMGQRERLWATASLRKRAGAWEAGAGPVWSTSTFWDDRTR